MSVHSTSTWAWLNDIKWVELWFNNNVTFDNFVSLFWQYKNLVLSEVKWRNGFEKDFGVEIRAKKIAEQFENLQMETTQFWKQLPALKMQMHRKWIGNIPSAHKYALFSIRVMIFYFSFISMMIWMKSDCVLKRENN